MLEKRSSTSLHFVLFKNGFTVAHKNDDFDSTCKRAFMSRRFENLICSAVLSQLFLIMQDNTAMQYSMLRKKIEFYWAVYCPGAESDIQTVMLLWSLTNEYDKRLFVIKVQMHQSWL